MTRWISHDLFAHIPECDGYLPLSIAFAQFAAIKCDADPFDQKGLSTALSGSSDVQELLRWFVRLLQSGKLKSISRPLGGGSIMKMSSSHWHADNLVERFMTSQYSRAKPFESDAQSDAWIFVDEKDYLHLWEEHQEQLFAAYKKPTTSMPRKVRANPEAPHLGVENSLLGLTAVEEAVGFRRSTIYKLIDEGRFPEQIKVGNRSLWRRADIIQWIDQAGRRSD